MNLHTKAHKGVKHWIREDKEQWDGSTVGSKNEFGLLSSFPVSLPFIAALAINTHGNSSIIF